MIVVDSAPLIYLSKTGNLELLKKLYGRILVPRGVWEEVVTQGRGRPGASEVESARRDGWLRTEKVSVPEMLEAEGADGADGEVITLARSRRLPVLTNDALVVAIARTHGVKAKWLTEALIEAVHDRVLSAKEARLILRDLVRSGLRVKSEVLAEVVHMMERSTS